MLQRVVIVNDTVNKNIVAIQNMGDDLMPPLKIKRDTALIVIEDEPALTNQAKIQRKKAEVVEYQNEDEKATEEEEKVPWLLEDSEQRAFIGRHMQTKITEEQTSVYYIMVRDKNEVRMQRVNRWYKFAPKIQYETMTLEEAEEKMQKKTKEQVVEKNTTQKEEEKEEEVEYKEVFDDDDGEAEVAQTEKKKRKKLDPAGKDLRKLVKTYES